MSDKQKTSAESSLQAGDNTAVNNVLPSPASSEETLKNAKELQRGSVIPSRPERVRLGHAIEEMYENCIVMWEALEEMEDCCKAFKHEHCYCLTAVGALSKVSRYPNSAKLAKQNPKP